MDSYSGGKSRRGDPDTAEGAARRVKATKVELIILDILDKYAPEGRSLCCVEVHNYYLQDFVPTQEQSQPSTIDSFSPRFTDLVEKGLIIQLPKQSRVNRTGRNRSQLVYALSNIGVAKINQIKGKLD